MDATGDEHGRARRCAVNGDIGPIPASQYRIIPVDFACRFGIPRRRRNQLEFQSDIRHLSSDLEQQR